jgi:hypothetical protein
VLCRLPRPDSAAGCADPRSLTKTALGCWLQLRGRSWSRFLARRTELNTIAERANIFAGARFDLVNTNQTGSPRLTFMLDYLRGGIRRTMVIYTKGR